MTTSQDNRIFKAGILSHVKIRVKAIFARVTEIKSKMSLLSMKYPKIILHICQINLLSKIRVAMPMSSIRKKKAEIVLCARLFSKRLSQCQFWISRPPTDLVDKRYNYFKNKDEITSVKFSHIAEASSLSYAKGINIAQNGKNYQVYQ